MKRGRAFPGQVFQCVRAHPHQLPLQGSITRSESALAAESKHDDRLDLALLDELEQLDDVGPQVTAATPPIRVAVSPAAPAAAASPAPAASAATPPWRPSIA